MPDFDSTSNNSGNLEYNVAGTMDGSTLNSSQNFSLPSSSSSVTAEEQPCVMTSSSNPSPMMGRSVTGILLLSSSPISSDGRGQRRRRAPDMQLGRCPWIRVYDNVTYIVAGIILRDSSDVGELPEILLIQEAKKKCRGKWYIPAGHVEPGETIEAACQREVLEETGFECRVDGLICMETRGSGWYRMSFACTITGGNLKTVADRESLAAGWHSIEKVRQQRRSTASLSTAADTASADNFQLRCRDFMPIIDEALRWREWRKTVPAEILEAQEQRAHISENGASLSAHISALSLESPDDLARTLAREKFAPVMNRNEAQPGLFIEFVIVKRNVVTEKMECLVHGSIQDQLQLLDDTMDSFPMVEFGFEFFFPMVVSKCYRHIFEDGHQAIDLPEAVLGMWCLPAPLESVRQGLRLRIFCRHKLAVAKAPLCVPQRYHWLALEDERVLAALRLLPGQFRPILLML